MNRKAWLMFLAAGISLQSCSDPAAALCHSLSDRQSLIDDRAQADPSHDDCDEYLRDKDAGSKPNQSGILH